MRVLLFGATMLLTMAACFPPLPPENPDARSAAGAIAAQAATSRPRPSDEALGWNVQIAGGKVRWRECVTLQACSLLEREVEVDEVRSFEVVGRTQPTRPDGTLAAETNIVRIKFAR